MTNTVAFVVAILSRNITKIMLIEMEGMLIAIQPDLIQ